MSMQVYVCPFSNVATLWRQKCVGSESERQVHGVVFILGCTVSSDFNNLGLKVPQPQGFCLPWKLFSGI